MTKSKAAEQAELEERFVRYLKEKWTIDDIVAAEGIDRRIVIRKRNEIAQMHGLSTKGTQGKTLPPGIDDESYTLRLNLANRMADLRVKKHFNEIRKLIGLNNAQQKRAMNDRSHDWKLSELQKFAKAQGQSFEVFMTKNLAKPPKIGFE